MLSGSVSYRKTFDFLKKKNTKKTSIIYKIGPDVSFSSYTKTMSHFWNRCVNFCWTETKRSEKMIWVDKGLLECISTCYTTTTTNRKNEFFPALLTTYINHYLYIFFYFNIHQYIHKTAHIKTPNNQSNPLCPLNMLKNNYCDSEF